MSWTSHVNQEVLVGKLPTNRWATGTTPTALRIMQGSFSLFLSGLFLSLSLALWCFSLSPWFLSLSLAIELSGSVVSLSWCFVSVSFSVLHSKTRLLSVALSPLVSLCLSLLPSLSLLLSFLLPVSLALSLPPSLTGRLSK